MRVSVWLMTSFVQARVSNRHGRLIPDRHSTAVQQALATPRG